MTKEGGPGEPDRSYKTMYIKKDNGEMEEGPSFTISKFTWETYKTGVSLNQRTALLLDEEKAGLINFCSNQVLGIPTQIMSTSLQNNALPSPGSTFTTDLFCVDTLCFTYPFSQRVLDWCPHPFFIEGTW
jgi:hypothetical protein